MPLQNKVGENMNSNIDNFQYGFPIEKLVFVRFQKTVTIPASSVFELTREDINWFVPRGYRPIGLVGFEVPSANVIVRGVDPFHNSAANSPMIWLRNKASSAYTDAIIAVTYAYADVEMPWSESEDIVFHNRYKYGDSDTTTWSDWERDLPEGAGVLLTMENAGPVTSE